MAKYVVCDEVNGDMFTQEFDNHNDALLYAIDTWNRLSYYDKTRRNAFYVLESANPDPDAEEHLDGCFVEKYK